MTWGGIPVQLFSPSNSKKTCSWLLQNMSMLGKITLCNRIDSLLSARCFLPLFKRWEYTDYNPCLRTDKKNNHLGFPWILFLLIFCAEFEAWGGSELFHNISFRELILSFQARVTKGCTIVMPFNLSQGKKRTFDETASTYVPLAQQVEAFHKRTPTRYHLRNRKDDISKFLSSIILGWSLP